MKFDIDLNYCAASIHGRSIQLSILHTIKYSEICDYLIAIALSIDGERYLYFETNLVQLLKVH